MHPGAPPQSCRYVFTGPGGAFVGHQPRGTPVTPCKNIYIYIYIYKESRGLTSVQMVYTSSKLQFELLRWSISCMQDNKVTWNFPKLPSWVLNAKQQRHLKFPRVAKLSSEWKTTTSPEISQSCQAEFWMTEVLHLFRCFTHTRQKMIHHRICRELNPMQT